MKPCVYPTSQSGAMRRSLCCLVVVACLRMGLAGHPHGHGRGVATRSHVQATAAVHAAEAAAAPEEARKAADVAEHVARRSSSAVHDTIVALRLTQGALHAAKLEADAEELGRMVNGLEAGADGDDAELRRLEARLERLRGRYSAKMKETRAHSDLYYRQKLDDIYGGIESAEYQLDRLVEPGVSSRRIEYDSTIVPYPGAIEQFGRQDTARDLTSESIYQSDAMVDSIESAQAMEGKRAVHRALTHLRGAAISAYDGIARAHLKNVENFARNHHWRQEHRVRHLAEEEDDVHRWAFPVGKNADSEPAMSSPAPAQAVAIKSTDATAGAAAAAEALLAEHAFTHDHELAAAHDLEAVARAAAAAPQAGFGKK